jgi:hypothetical protein
VTADLLNAHLRDNLNALKAPPSAHFEANETSDYTTTSTTFVDVDATNLTLTITPTGQEVMVHCHGNVISSDSWGRVFFDVAVDGSRIGGDDGIVQIQGNITPAFSFTRLITGLTAGQAHTFKLQWKVGSYTGTLFAGAGTSGKDTHPQFWVREVS